jgi:pyruvate,water dikinase
MPILWLDQPECEDVERVGGKVAHLSHLAGQHRVPPGFCLTTAAFGRWTPQATSFPRELYDEVAAAYDALAQQCRESRPPVAVRSSAIDEDGQDASFAGQYETYLNICGVEAVTDAIVRCWRSVYSERVVTYRSRQGFDPHGVQLAVLVQQLVPADASAVVFSANPISGRRDEIVINASWGLGESIVGGTVTPDSYWVRKADLGLARCEIAKKERMTVSIPGGTREVPVPGMLSGEPALTDAQVVEMAELARVLEARMGWPVDIECAIRDDTLYLLQCRPITTLP